MSGCIQMGGNSLVDLHLHTTASDGQYPPEQVVRMAHERGVTFLAITDHDSVNGVEKARTAAAALGVGFVSGIEISTKGNRELHMLGYKIDSNNKELCDMCATFQRDRDERKYRILDYLREKGMPLSLEEVEMQAGGGLIARPHFARAMVKAGYVRDVRAAFDLYLGTPEFDRIERPKISPEHGIALIHRAGGVAVLAHPIQLKLEDDALDRFVGTLAEQGLDGLECYYSTHSPERRSYYLTLAGKYRLLITGGTDFHGEAVKPDIEIGTGINGSVAFDESMNPFS